MKMKSLKIEIFKENNCMDLDEIDSVYAFNRECVIECNTEKDQQSKKGSLIKRTRSAGWMSIFRPCNTRCLMYEMFRGGSRLQLWAVLVWMCQ